MYSILNNVKRVHIIVFIIATLAFLTSIFAQFVLNKQPCLLCLTSRVLYVAVALAAFLAIRINKALLRKTLVSTVTLSLAFSFYHLGVENHWWAPPKGCTYTLPTADELKDLKKQFNLPHSRCDQVNWEILGLSSTIWNFGVFAGLFWMTTLSHAMALSRRKQENENS